MRVAFAGFLHESNSFARAAADMAAFLQGGGYIPLTRGAALRETVRGVNLGISGMLDYADRAGWECVPILWAGAIPSAPVTRDAFETIADDIVQGLAECGPIDAICLDLHGAMVAEHVEAVSYTHLDVYKRQASDGRRAWVPRQGLCRDKARWPPSGSGPPPWRGPGIHAGPWRHGWPLARAAMVAWSCQIP